MIVVGALQRDYYQNSFDWWAHDTIRVTPKLTLNFGVRYTYHGVLHDANNNITTFVPDKGFVGPGNGLDSLYPKDLNNFAPRLGFAWTPQKNGKTVVRGAWHLYDVPALNFFTANTGRRTALTQSIANRGPNRCTPSPRGTSCSAGRRCSAPGPYRLWRFRRR